MSVIVLDHLAVCVRLFLPVDNSQVRIGWTLVASGAAALPIGLERPEEFVTAMRSAVAA